MPSTHATRATRIDLLRASAIVVVSVIGIAGISWAGERAVGLSSSASALLAAGEDTLVVAHRGDAALAPENTLPAIDAAVAAGADIVELDVQRSADGIPIVMHDWTVDRTTDGSGPVWALTTAELGALDASAGAGAPAAVPTLAAALDVLAATRSVVMLELKGAWNTHQVAQVAELVRVAALTGRAVLASFDLFTLRAAHAAAPGIPRLLLTRHLASIEVAIADAAATAIGVSMATLEQDPDAVARLSRSGIGVFLYTLNDAERWAAALELGVRGIITDDPGALRPWIADALERRPERSPGWISDRPA